jgi:hypothetical protein
LSRIPVAAVGIAVLVIGVAACGPVQDGQGSPVVVDVLPTATAPPVRSPTPAAATPTPGIAATDAPAMPPVAEDEGLLAVLPEDVAGTPVEREALAFQEASGQPDFAASIGSAAFFVAPGPGDLVSGLVAKPRDGVYSEAWYRDWRETYDEGACAQANGIGGRAEASIGGRAVSITTCAGGMRVYHAWVEEQGVVVSLIAIGENRWGEQVMASLRP